MKACLENFRTWPVSGAVVVHRYSEIDLEQLQEIIDQDLDNFLDFVKAVEDYYRGKN